MTVCIAAICDLGRTIIMVADKRIGLGFIEADIGFKFSWLCPTWRLLLAGNDFSAATEISRWATFHLNMKTRKLPEVQSEMVQDALVTAYQQVRTQRIESRYLRPRGWTLAQFKEKGRDFLPVSVYTEIDSVLAGWDVEVDIIACGFEGKTADIVRVRNPGAASIEGSSHVEVIGSGDYLAFASLYRRGYKDTMPLREALYYVYEAKIAAERASGVGEPSDVVIMKRDKQGLNEKLLIDDDQNAIRSICDRLKPKDLSSGDLNDMDSAIRRAARFARRLGKRPTPSTS